MNGKARCSETPEPLGAEPYHPPQPKSIHEHLHDTAELARKRANDTVDDATEAKLRAAYHEIAALSLRIFV